MAIPEIAAHLGLTPLRVMRLLEQAYARREIETISVQPVSVATVRDRFESWRAEDPETRTFKELARLAGYGSSSHVQRLLGEIPTAPVIKGEVVYPGRIATTISPAHGGRLTQAMGYAPAEIPGL